MKAAFHTLGCKVNQYETEAIKEAFVSRGAEIISDDESADIYVINTCTVTGIADRKSRQFMRRAKNLNPDAVVVATGCYAQVAAEEIEKMPEVDLIIGNDLKSEIAERAIRLLNVKKACKASAGQVPNNIYEEQDIGSYDVKDDSLSFENAMSHVLRYEQLSEYEDLGTVTSDESSMCRAYIKIEDGCDRFCSYCKIPHARGRVRSRLPQDVTDEARALIAKGYKEIILTGINTALYGTENGFKFERMDDEEGLSGLETIVKRINDIPGDFRIRLSSLEPTVVNAEDVTKLLGYEKLCHHLHLSIQSGSDDVLRAMNRRYDRRQYMDIVKALRDFDPLYGITTDIIVGFPGETVDDFEATLDIVRRAEFARVHSFRYSPRKGTGGAKLPNRVAGEVSKLRSSILDEAADKVSKVFNEKNFDVVHRVLIEEEQDGFLTGYTDNYIKVYIKDNSPAEVANEKQNKQNRARLGEFCRVQLIENYKDGCRAEEVYK